MSPKVVTTITKVTTYWKTAHLSGVELYKNVKIFKIV